MFDFLALITNKYYWKLHSYIIKFIMRCYGIKIGKNFYCEGIPKLKIKGKGSNIIIGNNVNFLGSIDLRNRENGKIFIGNNVSIDNDVRLVSANDATLSIGDYTGIANYTIFNCGIDVSIGKNCLISGMCYFQSSEHGINKELLINEQKHSYGKITLGDDVWIAANVVVAKNVQLDDGCIVGAKSFLRNCKFDSHSIIAGVPCQKIGIRT